MLVNVAKYGYLVYLRCKSVANFMANLQHNTITDMATVSIYLDTRRARKDGTFPVKLYVNHNGRFYIKTEFSSTLKNWDRNQFSKTEPNHKARNVVLRNLINKAENAIYDLEKENRLRGISDKRLKDIIEHAIANKEESRRAVLPLFDEFIDSKSRNGTKEFYLSTKSKVEMFDKNCTFGCIDKKWLLGFDGFLQSKGLGVNTRGIHLKNLRALFNYAIDEEITNNYPFRKFIIKKEETRKRSLTVEQLRMFMDYPCGRFLQRYKDIFMLMFYLIGINAVDLFGTKGIRDGRLEYRRTKTGKLYSIKVEPEAMEIIQKYKGNEYLLDILDSYSDYRMFLIRMNASLKLIGDVKIGKDGKKEITPLFPDISTYWARHTWATIAASLDIPKETISAALGHEIGSPVTSIYIKFDQNKVDEANRRVIDYVLYNE